jgi:hypothetical protein
MKTPRSPENIYRRFGETRSLHFQTLKIETGNSSKTLVSVRLHGVTLYKRKIFIHCRKQYWPWNAVSNLSILSFRGDSVVILILLLTTALVASVLETSGKFIRKDSKIGALKDHKMLTTVDQYYRSLYINNHFLIRLIFLP